VDLTAISGEAAGDGGIAHGAILAEFAEAVWDDDEARLEAARQAVIDAMGPAALIDAAGVAATFNAIDRIADSTGIPIDAARIEPTADFRASLGIDAFPSRTAQEG
jgi:hypothetical protein